MRHRGLPRNQITPTAKLGALIPRRQRNSFLHRFAAEIKAGPPPPLVRPGWLKGLLVALSLAVGAYPALKISSSFGNTVAILTFVTLGAAFVGAMITRPFRIEFPKELASAGSFALWIRSHKADLADKSQRAWTRDQIAARVREIVIDTLACEKNYREDARFVEDLGLS